MVIRTCEKFQVNLNDNVRTAIESELKSHQFEALNEASISNRLYQIYEHIFSASTDSWHGRATENLRSLRLLQTEYVVLRSGYLSFTEEICHQCSQYFTDASRNLEILNEVARRIKERAIEPSFGLLDQTRKQLEYVKKEVEAVEFT
jgi:hypothetical protein